MANKNSKPEGHPDFPKGGVPFDKSVDIGPQEYEYMSPLQAEMIHKKRVNAQIESRKRRYGQ